ncbi:hypothetical protein BDP55DRAFT_670461 [Colletotrichum godetiae]|uniref:Uncharacterized protein n=1 Tax=Colletotrichum godetiae TaxID=1209918 RepID=A0AAJ0AFX3_9PEZI|nr:uncharacterized protein BDP55DRAFT_670461 [Colletotrichum godetiae]KAK1673173.1 hypothetical protein BDP55DRAFT_670461 [Colletotrichum godetiae]
MNVFLKFEDFRCRSTHHFWLNGRYLTTLSKLGNANRIVRRTRTRHPSKRLQH